LNKMCCWHLLFIEKCFDVVDKSGDQRGWLEHMRSPKCFKMSFRLFGVMLILLRLLSSVWLL
jgi:hypothetical protein